MADYDVTLKDRTVERVTAADAFQQEGPMTTFFRTGRDRGVLDSWSTRVFSVRTAEVIHVRRLDPVDDAAPESSTGPLRVLAGGGPMSSTGR